MSPYGIPKEEGGESKENEAWMQQCISKVMKDGKSKDSAIAICKATLKKSKDNKSTASFIIDEILIGRYHGM